MNYVHIKRDQHPQTSSSLPWWCDTGPIRDFLDAFGLLAAFCMLLVQMLAYGIILFVIAAIVVCCHDLVRCMHDLF